MRIFAYRGAVVAANHFGHALDVLGIESAAGVFDITGGLKTLSSKVLAGLAPAEVGGSAQASVTISFPPIDEKDVEFKRVEAQALAEKLNKAVLEKAELQEKLAGEIMENQALKENAADDARKMKSLRQCIQNLANTIHSLQEKIDLFEEIEADREADAARGVRSTFDPEEVDDAELDAVAATWLKNSHSCGVEGDLPAVSYGAPPAESWRADGDPDVQAGALPADFDPIATAEAVRDTLIHDESGFAIGGLTAVIDPAIPTGYAALVAADGRREVFDVSSADAVELAAREIVRREWPLGTPVGQIVGMVVDQVKAAPDWARDNKAIGQEAARMGLRRPAGFVGTRKPAQVPEPECRPAVGAALKQSFASSELVPVVEKPARDLRGLSRLAQLHGETVARMADEGMTDGEIASEINNTARRNDWLTPATAKSVRLEMERAA